MNKTHKKYPAMKKFVLQFSLAFLMLFAVSTSALAQGGGPPPPPGNHGGEEDLKPTPVGSGLVLLLALGAAYGARKVYRVRRKF